MKLAARIERVITNHWFAMQPNIIRRFINALLSPLCRLTARRSAHNRALIVKRKTSAKNSPRHPVIVVVGNLVAGGAGKTPITIAISRFLIGQGKQTAVVCRGAGSARNQAASVVNSKSTVAQVGDEALLLARATGVPVAVSIERARAIELLIHTYPDLEVIVSDDGLQHTGLMRHFELAVFDRRGAGNGKLLPAGPLREPLSHLPSMDAVVINLGLTGKEPGSNPPLTISHPVMFTSTTRVTGVCPLSEWRHKTERPTAATVATAIETTKAQAKDRIDQFRKLIADQPLAAVAGIASPQSFFDLLNSLEITHQPYP
ncbi:MAG: tetraacyldisaccharide 4'-kinase, partial [Burkholderiaceae bacterium]